MKIAIVILPDSHRVIIQNGTRVTVVAHNMANNGMLNFLKPNISSLNFQHNHDIIERIDIISQFQSLISVEEHEGKLAVKDYKPDIVLSSEHVLEQFQNKIYSSIFIKLLPLIMIVSIIIFII